MRIRVKICGITDGAGLRSAAESGADCLGFVFAESERQGEKLTEFGSLRR